MNLFESIEPLLGDDGVTLHECRDCGTKLAPTAEVCRCCGSREIAHYEW